MRPKEMPVHRIHLRGPWDFRWRTPAPAGSPPEGRVTMPAGWPGPPDAAGCVLFQRRFQRPTRLEPRQRVWVVFDGVGGTAAVSLNEAPLGRLTGAGRFDVTGILQPTNVLAVELTFDPASGGAGGLFAPVALEIWEGPTERNGNC